MAIKKKVSVLLLVLIIGAILASCGHHKKEKPPIALDGLSEAQFCSDGDAFSYMIDGRVYRYFRTLPDRYLKVGDIKAYELVEGWMYKYFAELFGSSDGLVRFRPSKDAGDGYAEVYLASDLADVPDWAAQLASYPEYDRDYVNGMNYNAQFIRIEGVDPGVEFPAAVLIESKAELDEYIASNSSRFDFSGNGFKDAIEKYNDVWFSNNQLVIAILEEGSGSISHRLAGVYKDPPPNCFLIIDRYVPEAGTFDMAHWHVFIELEALRGAGGVYPYGLSKDYDIKVLSFTAYDQ